MMAKENHQERLKIAGMSVSTPLRKRLPRSISTLTPDRTTFWLRFHGGVWLMERIYLLSFTSLPPLHTQLKKPPQMIFQGGKCVWKNNDLQPEGKINENQPTLECGSWWQVTWMMYDATTFPDVSVLAHEVEAMCSVRPCKRQRL